MACGAADLHHAAAWPALTPAARMESSVQLVLGLVTRSAVSAARPHLNATAHQRRGRAACCGSAACHRCGLPRATGVAYSMPRVWGANGCTAGPLGVQPNPRAAASGAAVSSTRAPAAPVWQRCGTASTAAWPLGIDGVLAVAAGGIAQGVTEPPVARP